VTLAATAENLGWCALGVLVVLAVTFVASRITGRNNVIDTAWGVLFVMIAAVSFTTSAGSGDPMRRALLLALPCVWGLRLAVHVGRRSIGKGEDPRYERLLDKAPGNRTWYALRTIYLLQGVLALVIATPIWVGAFEPHPVRVVAWLGVVVWAVGVFFETVGDAQMERWRAQPGHRGKVIDVGLWRYTRHPNYFGDACVWWGIFLVAADSWPGVVTIFAPVLMTWLLVKGSGVRILEQHMAGREGWDDYAARTSMFVPMPPRRRSADRAA
jgi:steroid 5-alpha reductase family enzyme